MKYEFDPGQALGSRITEMSPQALCELAAKLCQLIQEEAGTRAYRGGVYPENISMDAEGNVALGPAKLSGWEGQELQFLPPELYWNGKRGSYSDVYALGLLLYYAANQGKLPYEGECKDPQLRRMDGEDFPPPKGIGRRLGEIIEKATRFDAAKRYQNVEELRIMLESLVKNLYLNGAPSAEVIFKKSDDDLSELERIMVGIIEKGGDEPLPQEPEPEAENAAPEESAVSEENGEEPPAEEKAQEEKPPEEPEQVRLYEPSHHKVPARQPIPILTEEKHPELEPVIPSRQNITPAVQYSKSAERERKIAAEARKRRRRPMVVILVLCAILIVVALLANAWLRDVIWEDDEQPSPTPTADNNSVLVAPPPSATPAAEEPKAKGESSYEIVQEDLSWTEARDRAEEMGGHLAVISDEEEFNKVVTLAADSGVRCLWIGLYREEGLNRWVTGETSSYYPWDTAAGEPSYVDSGDNVAEDYGMLWYNGTGDQAGWAYNDSRNDPVGDYPEWYSGQIGFVCEYETEATE